MSEILALGAVLAIALLGGRRNNDVPPTEAELDAWDEADQETDRYRQSQFLKLRNESTNTKERTK